MTAVVHVITDLGPTEEPGMVVPAELGHAVTVGGRWAWLSERKQTKTDTFIKFRYAAQEPT